MGARLTVVLDDEELYRRLKVKAAEDGVSMKDLIEEGLRHVLGERKAEPEPKVFDWERYEEMLEEFRKEDEALGIDPSSYPTDLSDIKHHLYGRPKRELRVAEERGAYSAE
jgi:hypothetical protein